LRHLCCELGEKRAELLSGAEPKTPCTEPNSKRVYEQTEEAKKKQKKRKKKRGGGEKEKKRETFEE